MTLKPKRIYEFGPFRLDASRGLLSKGDSPVALTPKATETLLVLVESPGELVEKTELMGRVWPDTSVEDSNLTFNIAVLRKTLSDDRHNGSRFIETVPRRGYRFVAPVVTREYDGAAPGTAISEISAPPPHFPITVNGRRYGYFSAAAAIVAVLAGLGWWSTRAAPEATILGSR
jgi:DNA-binding winged helix-turn-helix (wHTH) protein